MRRFLAVVTLIAAGCRPSAELTTAPREDPSAVGDHSVGETPTHLLLPGGSLLYTAADDAAPVLHLDVPEDRDSPARAVAVVGRDGEYWEIETIDGEGLEGIAAEPLDGLSYYRLRLWVPVGTGTEIWPIPPGPDAPTARELAIADAQASGILGALQQTYNPPLQAGGFRPEDRTTDFRIAAGAKVFWPDGREAGEVRHELEVDAAGSVTGQDATAADSRVAACVAKDWTFPQSLAGSFETTFTFATAD